MMSLHTPKISDSSNYKTLYLKISFLLHKIKKICELKIKSTNIHTFIYRIMKNVKYV